MCVCVCVCVCVEWLFVFICGLHEIYFQTLIDS